MAGYESLCRTSSQRKALLGTRLQIRFTEWENHDDGDEGQGDRKIAEHLITLAVREKDNFETVTVTQKVPKKTADGRREGDCGWQESDGLRGNQKTIKKDKPSRLHARRQMLRSSILSRRRCRMGSR
ncbi:MAG: hypothetical protein ACLTDS_04610 [Bianqueaceae bacterium]